RQPVRRRARRAHAAPWRPPRPGGRGARARRSGRNSPRLFVFQAEAGIRDFHVTGVQTCALPISQPWASHVASRDASVVAGSRSMILYQCTVCPQPQAIVWDGPTIRYATESQQIAAISRDGSTVVSHTAVYPRPHHAMRWVLEQDHMEELDLSGFELDRAIDPNLTEYSTVATDVSRDGTWILAETVLWRLDAPPVPITDLLEASCIDPDDWIPGATWFGVRISLEGRALV